MGLDLFRHKTRLSGNRRDCTPVPSAEYGSMGGVAAEACHPSSMCKQLPGD